MKSPASFEYEQKLWETGIERIAGIDEVGRGAWAGPVVAAAVVFPAFFKPDFDLFDSKLLRPRQREELSGKIERVAKFGIGVVGIPTINKLGIGQATQKAFKKAVRAIKDVNCEHFLIDAFYIRNWSKERQFAIKKGDRICASIAAASVVAKVYRDRLMRNLSLKYPIYGFESHKGYGTKRHQEAIRKFNFSSVHRKSFNLGYLVQ